MKVTTKYLGNNVDKKRQLTFNKFIHFLYQEFPLVEDLVIVFTTERLPKMSTGSRFSNNLIYVLTEKRINRDILRTLAHEWIHEYQMSILGRKQGPDIGGRNEDEANAIAGQLIKKFEKKYPEKEDEMYE